MRSYQFPVNEETTALLFAEVHRIRQAHPEECLANDQLWSDRSEKGNGITRDRTTGTLCYTIGVFQENGEKQEYFAMRENTDALVKSALYKVISKLIEPYENL